MSVVVEKKRIRKEKRDLRNSIDPELKNEWDKSIVIQLMGILSQHEIKVVHCYLPMGSEVDVLPFIKYVLDHKIVVVCPKTLPNRLLEHRVLKSLDELEEGVMKTFHPKHPTIYTGKYDLIIVPGLAFDLKNYRLGYGGGYYDGFLAQHESALKVGVFYSFQVVDLVPIESHDLALDFVITPV